MKDRLSAALGALELNPEWSSKNAHHEYLQHKANAARRGIEFLLTFDEWYGWWQGVGRYKNRGRHRDEFVMARIGDQGPYALGNIECITARRNCVEGNVRRVRGPRRTS